MEMVKTIMAFIVSGLCLIAIGQTNEAPVIAVPHSWFVTNTVIKTNTFTAPSNFRIVRGQLYNIQNSRLWECFTGEVESKREGIVFLNTYQERKQSYLPGGRVGGNGSIGAYIGGPDPVARTTKWKDYGRTIALTNAPNYTNLTTGQDVELWLMRVGTYEDAARTLELWDRGLPHSGIVITTNRVKKAVSQKP